MQLPWLSGHGEDYYHICINKCDPISKKHPEKTVSAANCYSFRLMIITDQFSHLIHFRSVLYLVSSWLTCLLKSKLRGSTLSVTTATFICKMKLEDKTLMLQTWKDGYTFIIIYRKPHIICMGAHKSL